MSDQKEPLNVHNSDVPVVCQACEARHRGVCGALAPDQLLQLSKHTSKHVYQASREIVAAGTEVDSYSNILSGTVKLTKLLADGRQQIVGLQFAPDFLGRPFRHQTTVSAEAATDVRVCSFPKSVLEDLVRQSPDLEHALHEQTLAELDEARDWLLALGRKTASEKVASFILMIAVNIDPEADPEGTSREFELPLKRAEIADFLGLTIETVSRHITKLRKTGVIELVNNRLVRVPSLSRLKAAAETET